jgi:hypothetical protein
VRPGVRATSHFVSLLAAQPASYQFWRAFPDK